MTNLDDSLQDLSEVVQCRLVVLDEGMRVLAYSIHESEQDRARLSHLLAHSDTWEPLPAGTDGPTARTAGDGTEWVLLPLRDDRHRVGHLLHVRTKGDPAPPADLLAEGAARLGVLLSLRTMYAERDAARARGCSRSSSASTRRPTNKSAPQGRSSTKRSSAPPTRTAPSSSLSRPVTPTGPGRRAPRWRRPRRCRPPAARLGPPRRGRGNPRRRR